jgi:hypothetical protein
VALPRFCHAQGSVRSGMVKAKDGIELFLRHTGGSGRAIILTHA